MKRKEGKKKKEAKKEEEATRKEAVASMAKVMEGYSLW